jgi:hypothetical protein
VGTEPSFKNTSSTSAFGTLQPISENESNELLR